MKTVPAWTGPDPLTTRDYGRDHSKRSRYLSEAVLLLLLSAPIPACAAIDFTPAS